jgi:hypothetical protein
LQRYALLSGCLARSHHSLPFGLSQSQFRDLITFAVSGS